MQKFEINNPEALKLIEDFKSGAFIKPYMDKIKQFKMVFISIGVIIFLLVFVLIGKSLSRKVEDFGFVPPNLELQTAPATTPATSAYNSLKEEIFLFSTDLPDPIIPEISNTIDLKSEVF